MGLEDEAFAREFVQDLIHDVLLQKKNGGSDAAAVARRFVENIVATSLRISDGFQSRSDGRREAEGDDVLKPMLELSASKKELIRRGSSLFHESSENTRFSPKSRAVSMDHTVPVSDLSSSGSFSGSEEESASESDGSRPSSSRPRSRKQQHKKLPIEYRFYQDGHHNSVEEDEWLCRPQFDTKKDKVSPVEELEHYRHVYMGMQVYADDDDSERAADREGVDWVLRSSLPEYSSQAARACRPFKARRLIFQTNKYNQIVWVRYG